MSLLEPTGIGTVHKIQGRILLIDDDVGMRNAYLRLLKKYGYLAEVARDGNEAIEQLAIGTFDVILTDIVMPGMSGLEFLRIIREQGLDVPVLLMTGFPDIENAAQAVEFGATRYLIKPVDANTLKNAVHSAVQLRRPTHRKIKAPDLIDEVNKENASHTELEDRLNRALDGIWIAFQPIVDWPRHTVFAYEALLRTSEPSLASPPEFIQAAERLERLPELGQRVRAKVAQASKKVPARTLLFVNLHPLDIDDSELYAVDSPLSAIASRTVLEITERAAIKNINGLCSKIAELRDIGFRVAVDDLGAGYSGLSTFSLLEPDFVKLDMSLVRGIDNSDSRHRVVRAMVKLCEDLAIHVIGEGVETYSERDALLLEGCHLLQGYLFAKPDRDFPIPNW